MRNRRDRKSAVEILLAERKFHEVKNNWQIK